MKLFYACLLLFVAFHLNANPPRFQYCISYCINEDTVFDEHHHPVMNNGAVTFHCVNQVAELRNGDCPNDNNIGLNTVTSPTKCFRLKNYNGQAFQGDGSITYKDANNIEWSYYSFPREGEIDNPRAYISYSKTTKEVCLEIPLLKYKIVLFSTDAINNKEGYYESMVMQGSKLVVATIRESKPNEPTNPIESKITYDFSSFFETGKSNMIVTNPNPFHNEIRVTLPKTVLDSNTNLKMVLKDNTGKKIAEQNVEGLTTIINTTLVDKGKFILFLYKKDDILEYKQMFK